MPEEPLSTDPSDEGRYLDADCECGERGLEANENLVVNGKSAWHCNHCGRDYAPSQFQSEDK